MYAPELAAEQNLAQPQHVDNIVAALNEAQHLEQERQCSQNNNVANHIPVSQEQAAVDNNCVFKQRH